MSQFGEFVKTARKDLGYTLRELADKAELSFSQLSKIERGESNPSQSTIERIAYALNINKYELLALAGYLDAEILEDLLLPDPKNKGEIAPRIEYSHTSLSEHILDWLIGTENDLDIPQMKLIASELEDFYKVRRQRIIMEEAENLRVGIDTTSDRELRVAEPKAEYKQTPGRGSKTSE